MGYANTDMGYSHIKSHLIRNFAGIVAEAKLIKISCIYFLRTINNALAEIAPKAFNGIGIGIAMHILVFAVVNHFAIVYLSNQSIATPFIDKERCGTLY